jgi:hypothetical protein
VDTKPNLAIGTSADTTFGAVALCNDNVGSKLHNSPIFMNPLANTKDG